MGEEMQFDDFDVDALLEAQSSDDDGTDLPELERSLDDILNDDDEEFADVLGRPVPLIPDQNIDPSQRQISRFDQEFLRRPSDALNSSHRIEKKLDRKTDDLQEELTGDQHLVEASVGRNFPAEAAFGLGLSDRNVLLHKESDAAKKTAEEEETDVADSNTRFISGLRNLSSRESNGKLSSPIGLDSFTAAAGGSSSSSTKGGRPGAALAAAAAASRQTGPPDSAASKFAKTFSTRPKSLFSGTAELEKGVTSHATKSNEESSESYAAELELPQDEVDTNRAKPNDEFDITEDEGPGDEVYSAVIEECLDRVETLSSEVEILEQQHPDSSSDTDQGDDDRAEEGNEPQSHSLSDVHNNSSSEDDASGTDDEDNTDRFGAQQFVVPQHTQPIESSHADAVNSLIKEEEEEFSTISQKSDFSAFGSKSSVRSVTDSDEEELESSKEEDVVEQPAGNEVVVKSVEDEAPRKRTLQLAEEAEKRAASTGLHWEEGAVAQPMRLEGLQRGAPAIGLLQLDSGGALNYALKNNDLRRDHGTPQALAVHSNFIAIGMSKGPVLIIPSKYSATKSADETDAKPYILIPPASDRHQMAVSSMSFNQQGDLLLVGYSNGHIILWDVSKATVGKHIEKDNGAPVVHAVFVGQDVAASRTIRAITADSRGLTLLHSFTQIPFVRRFSHNNAVLLDGQRTGLVLSISPLLLDEETHGTGGTNSALGGASSPLNLGTVMSVVGAGANGDVGRKFLYDGASPGEEGGGLVVLATNQTALVVKLLPSLVVCARFIRPDGIRDGAIPYTAWRRTKGVSGSASVNSASAPGESSQNTPPKATTTTEGRPAENGHNREDVAAEAGTGRTSGEGGEKSPVLAMAWDKKVIILQLLKTQLKIIAQWELDTPAVGVAWLEQEMVVVTTSKDELCLFSSEGAEIERASLTEDNSGLGAVTYHTHFLNIFGNPEKAYHNSLAVRGAALYVLGPSQLWRARLLPWRDRIKSLQNAGDSLGAFHIAMEIYDGRSQGVTGLPRGLDAMREAIMPTLLSLLSSYIDEAFAYLSLAFGSSAAGTDSETALVSSSSSESKQLEGIPASNAGAVEDTAVEAREQYARVGGVAIEFCVHIHKTEVLFENVFSKFDAVGQRGTFLELLEPYILKDMLGGLAPEVMQALVEHYSSRGWLNRVEQCVLHMDIASLDFNQVVRVCRDHGLYSALIYLFTKGLDDFRSPLEELLAVAQHSDDPQLSRAYGLKLLVYIKYCFSGLAFPPGNGTLSPARLPQLRTELLEYLLDTTDGKNKDTSKNIETAGPEGLTACKYSRLLYLLTLDTQATLEVLGAAFPENGPLGVGKRDYVYPLIRTKSEEEVLNNLVESEGTLPNEDNVGEGLRLAQMTTDAVIHVLQTVDGCGSLPSKSEETAERWPSEDQVGDMFEFVAYFAAGRYAVVPGPVLSRIFLYLTSPLSEKPETLEARKTLKILKQREELMLAVLKAVPKSEWDAERTLELAQKSSFWQVTALLHAEMGDFAAALESYLKDASRPEDPFAFISDKMSAENGLEGSVLASFRECVLSHIPELIQLSPVSTLVMVLKHFSRENQHILKALAPHPRLLFNYMKAIMNIRSGGFGYADKEVKGSIRQGHLHAETSDGGSQPASSAGHPEDSSPAVSQSYLAELLERSGLEFTDEMAEDFVELLCRFEPKSVLSFLESYENYRLEHCLRLCQDYGITDAATFLLERVGDVASALSLVLADVQILLEDMDHALATAFPSLGLSKEIHKLREDELKKMREVKAVNSVLSAAIALCQRNTFRLEPRESETLWFRLLDRFVEPLRDINLQLRNSRAARSKQGLISSSSNNGFRWKVLDNDLAFEAVRNLLVHYIGEIVNGMMGFVPISVTMSKILEEHGEHEFGDFKVTILDMLSAYGYERAILGTANKLIEDDTFQNVYALRRGCSHAFIPSANACAVCGLRLDEPMDPSRSASAAVSSSTSSTEEKQKQKGKIGDDDDSKPSSSSSSSEYNRLRVRIFPCGHATHYHCVDADSGPRNSKRNALASVVVCPICAIKPVDVSRKTNDATLLRDTVIEVGGRKARDRDSSSGLLSQLGRMHKTTSRTFGRSRLEILKLLERGTDLHELGPSVELSLAPPVVTPYKRPVPPVPASSGSSSSSSGRRSSSLTAAVLSRQRKNKSRAR